MFVTVGNPPLTHRAATILVRESNGWWSLLFSLLNGPVLSRREMPVPAKRTQVRLAFPLHADDGGGLERVALRRITTFADAHALPFFTSGFLHEGWEV